MSAKPKRPPADRQNAGDTDDRRRVEQELRLANVKLSNALTDLKRSEHQIIQHQRLSALGQMASGIAHDFNNALMPILGFSDFLLTNPKMLDNREEVISMLRDIHAAAKDAAQSVARLRSFYRPPDSSALGPADVAAVIERALSLTQPRWKSTLNSLGLSIEILKELQPGLIASGNESELTDVFMNLMLNAVDAMPRGGALTIRSRAEDKWVVTEVQDTGIGMTEEVRRKCFEPFFTTKDHGTGMGLAVSYGIIRRHHGVIEVESESGKGATFRIRLPKWTPTAAAPAAGQPGEALAPVPPLRILVVDDELWTREFLYQCLTADGHRVQVASSGNDGLSEFRRAPFDLVITDRAMPDMNGDDLAANLRAEKPDIRVLLLTGFGDIMIAEGEKPRAVDQVLSKPVMLSDLRQAIRSLFVPR